MILPLRSIRPLVLGVLVASTVSVACAIAWITGTGGPIAARGGRVMEIAPIATPHYMQTDARWAREKLATTPESMAASGCTVCCVSMALARYGVDIAPGELNRRVRDASGFTPHGWLKWSMIERVSAGRIETEIPRAPEHDVIDDALEQGWPVVTKIRLRGTVPHWVLIVGKAGNEYLARDPLVAGELVEVSRRSRIIEAIRVIRPA
jgi:hypothetical protein